MIDPSSFGVKEAALKGLKVLAWQVGSAAAFAAIAASAVVIENVKISHPEYALYVTGGVAFINSFAVFVHNWFSSIDPEKARAIVDKADSQVEINSQGIGG